MKETIVIYIVELIKISPVGRPFEDFESEVVNQYFFHSEENALTHITCFVESRPKEELWEPQKIKKGSDLIKHYVYQTNNHTFYKAVLEKKVITFND